jgi:hypothetical protein
MLENSVDRMNVVEDAEHDRGILMAQPAEILTQRIVKTAIGPTLDIDQLTVRHHDRSLSD